MKNTYLETVDEVLRPRNLRKRRWRAFTKNKTALLGLAIVISLFIVAAFADDYLLAFFQDRDPNLLLAPFNPSIQDAYNRLQTPDRVHFLGLDGYGRDVLSRIIYGGRVSLLVGIFSAILGGLIGTSMGVLAGFLGGRVENIIMRAVDVLMAFPSLLMGMMILAVMQNIPGSGLFKAIFGIGIVLASGFARVSHAATLSVKENEYVLAAKAVGASKGRMIMRHILPNIFGELVVLTSLQTAQAIRTEASLSFIGLGVSPPTPTWGNMIRDGMQYILSTPWLSLYSGLAILISVLGFNLLGDGLRDVLDPRIQE